MLDIVKVFFGVWRVGEYWNMMFVCVRGDKFYSNWEILGGDLCIICIVVVSFVNCDDIS